MKYSYNRWSSLPYAGEKVPPQNPEEPLAGSWPLKYLKRDSDGKILSPEGKVIRFHLKDPRKINWKEELKYVHSTLNNLTDRQKEVADYWGTGVATKQWTPVIDRLIDTYGVTAPHAARILDTCHAAINDSFVVTWFLKYKLDVARPNQIDPDLATFLCTPRHPTYPSGHSVIAGCAETVLSYYFPTECNQLAELAEECAVSRLYGGVHFPVDNDEGLRLGRQIGLLVVKELEKQRNANDEAVDTRYTDSRSAKLPPITYEQVIPFDFRKICDSKLLPKDDVSNFNYIYKKWRKILW
ncbi:chloroperoxidase [Lottiidibacillus patelloidae]|uniref:Chloroperoxidase n=1 Tax=Lottiidibacillus patelloidae TaxID=2670334 RepID=A0A263BYU3_9BACI|nr:vanadium-dependent haloperoxidase [Lottiidibacillus patelloidae]OZM58336.1 chloroperoxidase [Lottiidibacillus patelloidae]